MNSLLKDILSRHFEKLQDQGAFREIEYNLEDGHFVHDWEPGGCSIFKLVKGGASARILKNILSGSLGLVEGCPLPLDDSVSLGVRNLLCPEELRPKFLKTSTLWLVGLVAIRNNTQPELREFEAFDNCEVQLQKGNSAVESVLKNLPKCKISIIQFSRKDEDLDYHVVIHGLQDLIHAHRILKVVSKELQRFDLLTLCRRSSIGSVAPIEIEGQFAIACMRSQ